MALIRSMQLECRMPCNYAVSVAMDTQMKSRVAYTRCQRGADNR